MSNKITITATVNTDAKKVWDYYTQPEHYKMEFCRSFMALPFRLQ